MFELLLELFNPSKQQEVKFTRLLVTLGVIAFLVGAPQSVFAQQWTKHRTASFNEPPGAIGRKQLLSSKHRRGYRQPVRISAPPGTRLSSATPGGFTGDAVGTLQVGLQIGEVYRFEATSAVGDFIVYPTIEVIDRLYPPEGQALRFPIPIELTKEELRLAAAGHFVTRVIYIEDPNNALPYRSAPDGSQEYFEVFPDQDPVEAAYGMGRPVAILRMGAKTPSDLAATADFNFGNPTVEFHAEGPQPIPTTATSGVAPISFSEAQARPSPRRVRPPSNPTPLK